MSPRAWQASTRHEETAGREALVATARVLGQRWERTQDDFRDLLNSVDPNDFSSGFYWRNGDPPEHRPMPMGFAEGFDQWPYPRYDAMPSARSRRIEGEPWGAVATSDWAAHGMHVAEPALDRTFEPGESPIQQETARLLRAALAQQSITEEATRSPAAMTKAAKRKKRKKKAIHDRLKGGSIAGRVHAMLATSAVGMVPAELANLVKVPVGKVHRALKHLRKRGKVRETHTRRPWRKHGAQAVWEAR